MTMPVKIKRALISVSDKTNVEVLVKRLHAQGVEIITTGGTAKVIEVAGVPYTPIEKVTGNPEAFSGRMKTLSFQISSSLLYRRDSQDDIKQAKELGIEAVDLVVCNLYPFVETCLKTSELEELVEKVDIGGPTMIRCSAKNFKHVTVLTDPNDYFSLIDHMDSNNGESLLEFRKKLAKKAFELTAHYEASISRALFSDEEASPEQHLSPMFSKELRYGENPHQKGWVVRDPLCPNGLASITPIQGKELSYNNFLDADAAYNSMNELHQSFSDLNVVTIVKHANTCGVAITNDLLKSLEKAWQGDPISAFGSILAFSKELDVKCANFLTDKFVEVIIAPSFSTEALTIFSKKKNLRLIALAPEVISNKSYVSRTISGGWVMQESDFGPDLDFKVVAGKAELKDDRDKFLFGTIVTKYLKSNAIGLFKCEDNCFELIGAGMGNPNRLISTVQAVEKAKENGHESLDNTMLVSDAFFPFRDNVDLAAKFDIPMILQPGGSIKDKEVIAAANEHGQSMVLTGRRHFNH
jgi:phosphoribosylaminoimidazolecarboxamide formyltransferase/IMP cyclohydrolase